MGNPKFAEELFDGMMGMNRVFQGAATIDSILNGNLIEKAAKAGLRSIFVGFETFSPENLKQSNKNQNYKRLCKSSRKTSFFGYNDKRKLAFRSWTTMTEMYSREQ